MWDDQQVTIEARMRMTLYIVEEPITVIILDGRCHKNDEESVEKSVL